MHAIEMTGTVDTEHRLVLDETLPITGPTRVRVIVLVENQDEVTEAAWLKSVATNESFDFLKDEREDIYSLADGKPFHD
jgi:hypothetical protein